MLINKINNVSNTAFKGYQHVINDVGETVMKFNFPYDYKNETCEIVIYKATPTSKFNYVINEKPLTTLKLDEKGYVVNIQDETNLDEEDAFAYEVIRKDKKTGKILYKGPDTGTNIKENNNGEYVFRTNNDLACVGIKNEKGEQLYYYRTSAYEDPVEGNYKYTLVTRKGPKPMRGGAGYLAMPDSFNPGVMYRGFKDENTGEIYKDEQVQKKAENTIRTFSNMYGGNLAGLQERIPYLRKNGIRVLFTNPIANGDDVSGHSYWNKNNMQIASRMGNMENFNSFFRELYKNGMTYVYDGTFTSEGLEGIHFQYALRWASKNPQSLYWFRMDSVKNTTLGLGVIPENKENVRHRIINSPINYVKQADGTYKKEKNKEYDANKETIYQIYDASQTTEEQVKARDIQIKTYQKLTEGSELDINSHDDTIIAYSFQIDPKEYEDRVDLINKLNKKDGTKIDLDTSDGTIFASHFTNFKMSKKTEGGFVTWDANTDMVKMNYYMSGYDDKNLQAITDPTERYYKQQMMERGAREVQDMAIQAGRYWTEKVKDIQTMYTAQTIGKANTVEEINKLIKEGKLPSEAKISEEALKNILNGNYLLKDKCVLSKDDVTLQALMKLPLDSLEFGENTVGVLSTSYFSNRATTDETIGKTRFELMRADNPHLVEPYQKNYEKVNNLFDYEIKNFAYAIADKVNEKSEEKLLDSDGNYTEFGEYVMELVGQDIAKYAMLKALGGTSFDTKILKDGEITYDYDKLKEGTTLKALGINAHNPEDEARMLEEKIEKGLRALDDKDIEYVTKSVLKRIEGTNVNSFRISEALVNIVARGLAWRLDAAKDVIDMDAIRNGDNDFSDQWTEVIKFWKQFVSTVKKYNPHSNLIAEITDVEYLMKDNYGQGSCPYKGLTNVLNTKFNGEPDAMIKFLNETGITTEAGYSYTFTDMLVNFAYNFENGELKDDNDNAHDIYKARLDLMMLTRNIDYMRYLYTFMGNHDKPRLLHGLALDMSLFHNHWTKRDENGLQAMQVLSGISNIDDLPIELKLNSNADNKDYFRTTSWKAIAMSKLLQDVINNDVKGNISDADLKKLNDALIDLTNGNYKNDVANINPQRIQIKELSSVNDAFDKIISIAQTKYGVTLSLAEKDSLKANINKWSNDNFRNYIIRGGIDWMDEKGTRNRKLARMILNKVDSIEAISDNEVNTNNEMYNDYSLYTISLAAMIRDAYVASGKNADKKDAIFSAVKDFVEEFNRDKVAAGTTELPKTIDYKTAMKQNGYAARDISTAIEMLLSQAEYKSGVKFENREELAGNIFRYATEPAVKKAAMTMEFLKGIFGIPTMYAGDELGMSGYDEKAKNIYLQNRNALWWSKAEIDDYIKNIMNTMNGTLSDRDNPDMTPLNDGTPYGMDILSHKKTRDEAQKRIAEINYLLGTNPVNKTELEAEKAELIRDLAKVSYLMQDADGNMTISLLYAGDVRHTNRFDYFKEYGIKNEADLQKFCNENEIDRKDVTSKYAPLQKKTDLDAIMLGSSIALPVGTIFVNALSKDKSEYVVKEIDGKLGVVRKDGGKIVISGKTSKNGVMILKHIKDAVKKVVSSPAKNIVFRGNGSNIKTRTYFNHQYNFVSDPYKKFEEPIEGQQLSIVSK